VIRTVDGELLSCGIGEYGRLGTGSTDDALVPAPLDSLVDENVVQIAAGSSHSLALTRSGKLFVWGRNDYGQLGFEDSYMDMYSLEDLPRRLDAQALEGKRLVSILAGRGRSGAVTEDGLFYTWGHRSSHMPSLLNPALVGGLKVL
jgi:alpha-tubulin suppressor-like RCC1 family protein